MTISRPASALPDSIPTADFVQRIRSGDPDALGEAYFQFAGPLLLLAHRLLGSTADAQDAVQDLFVGLPEALEGYAERGHLAAWLRRSLVRLVLMRMRRNRRRRETDLQPASQFPVQGGRDPFETWDLDRVLDLLPDDQRAIVVLKAVEGYSHDEIAALLGIRRNTSAVRFHRGLQRLRTAMERR
jgi:RNA polymerase sigma-70 factor (ECF subfamily)